ncbi:MAG: 4-(cytidine 5'-diphospho)-2-C-methyl-D-erythritol kinase [Pseudomonadota bacterium]
MGAGRTLHLRAPAKVNIFLKVLSRRPDGYHELATWMQKLDLVDSITLEARSSGISLDCPDSELAEDENNLAYKAAVLFFRETGIDGGVKIILKKHIPIAAGLGGGSSDGATILKGLNLLYAHPLSEAEMMNLGLALGADVPFFVSDFCAALATGVGEKLEKRESLENCYFLLINPGFPVSTKWVFENLDHSQLGNFALTIKGNPFILGPLSGNSQSDVNGNDLEQVTIRRYPEIGEIKSMLVDCGAATALMSGSGPTVFGIFTDLDQASRCRKEMLKRYPERVFFAKPLSS